MAFPKTLPLRVRPENCRFEIEIRKGALMPNRGLSGRSFNSSLVAARYFFGLANHHDNFDAYDSKYHAWNSVNVSPQKDIVGSRARIVRENGVRWFLRCQDLIDKYRPDVLYFDNTELPLGQAGPGYRRALSEFIAEVARRARRRPQREEDDRGASCRAG